MVFREQLKHNKPLNEEYYNMLNDKTYFSGEPIKIGDDVLFAYYNKNKMYTLVTIKKTDIEKYLYDKKTINKIIPTIL